MAAPDIGILRRAFVDVCRGYSVGHQAKDGRAVYIRHLGHREHADYDAIQARFEAIAVARGAQTEAQRLEVLYAKGMWSAGRETEIERQRDYIARMEEGRRTIAVPSVLRSHEAQIKQEREKLATMLMDRAKAVGMTVEIYAARRLEDHYLVHNMFTDSALQTPLIDSDTFDTLSDDEVDAIHDTYKAATEPCLEVNLRRLAMQDFFTSYYTLCGDNASTFWGKPVCELTYYQVRLSGVARYMKLLCDNTDLSRLSPAERNDPDAIERLHITQKNTATATVEGRVPTGLTASDIKETGIKYSPVPPAGMSGVELVKWLRKNQRPS